MGKRLYVGNLPYDADEDAIRAAFTENGGTVERLHIPLDRDTQRPRGFAFIEMSSDEEAQRAVEALNGSNFGSRTLKVSEAEERRPSSGPRGGSGGHRSADDGRGGYQARSDAPSPAGGDADGLNRDPAERARENRERRFGPDARPSREQDRGRKGRGGHGRRRHEDGGNDHGRRGGSRFDDYDY